MSDNVLEVKHLRVEFPTRKGLLVAVDDVSFEIAQGEILGLVGESGAGKSLTGAAICIFRTRKAYSRTGFSSVPESFGANVYTPVYTWFLRASIMGQIIS